MAAFATPSELASWLQKDLDTATATLALNIATSDISEFCGWSITQDSSVTMTVDGPRHSCSVFLGTQLLTGVTSVTEDGAALSSTQYRWSSTGELIRVGRWWTWKPRAIVAVVTHGYVTAPDKVKGICLNLAGRKYDNPTSLRSYQVGGVSETYAGSADTLGPGLTASEKEDLQGYQLAVVG